MKLLFISPDNRTLVISCVSGATAHDAREYATRWLNAEVYNSGKGVPLASQDVVGQETGEDAAEDVRLRAAGNASGRTNTLRLQVQRRVGKSSFSAWEDL